MKSRNPLFRHLRHGFTLVELMAVIAIMAILAAAGAVSAVHLVPGYQQRACEEERTQAVRAFVSDWLETRRLTGEDGNLSSVAEDWLTSYLSKNQVNCSNAAKSWKILLERDGSGYKVTISCQAHGGIDASAALGQSADSAGGIGWDGGFSPETTAP